MMVNGRPTRTGEFVFLAGSNAQAEADVYPKGAPYLVVIRGGTHLIIKPDEDEPLMASRRFFYELAAAAQACADDLCGGRVPHGAVTGHAA